MAADIMENVKPTRMELLQLRKKYALAEKGHKLLGEKRDALVVEFMKVIKKRREIRKTANESLSVAYRSLIKAKMGLGEKQIREVIKRTPWRKELDIKAENIMGIHLPKLNLIEMERIGIDFSMLETNASLDEAIEDMNGAFNRLIQVVEVEAAIERLAGEIEKTKRRVNALEYIFLPRIDATRRYIEMSLQEKEREDFCRRKKIKNVMDRKKN